jgi:putative membrane protein
MTKQAVWAWLLRLLKGALIGTGFILPGVSGGALAAVFGLYERMVRFIAHPFRDIVGEVRFFLPVGLGALGGMVVLSRPLGFLLSHFEVPVLWFFVGAILGTLPSLWKEAGKKGKGGRHLLILGVSFVLSLALLSYAAGHFGAAVPINTVTWVLAGALIALGALVPGLSPSNFLVYLGLYAPMVAAFKTLDPAVLIPLALGAALCLLALARLVSLLFAKAHALLFHAILGMVLASTVMIIPRHYHYVQPTTFLCLATLAVGAVLAQYMCRLEERHT